MIKEVPYYKTKPFHQDAKRYGVSFPENTNYWGKYINKKVVAVVGYDMFRNGKVKLRSDYVLPEYRGHRIYEELNTFRMNLLKEKGVEYAEIVCTEYSERLHKKLGAVEKQKYKKYIKLQYYW